MVNARADLPLHPLPPVAGHAVEWRVSDAPVSYESALAAMDARGAAVAQGTATELAWLLTHPPLYTAGTSTRAEHQTGLRFPLHTAGRGGQLTYHGPGQRVVYLMLDLRRRGADVRRFVVTVEEWIIQTLAEFGVRAERREDRIGVWVSRPDKGAGHEDKIAAIGIRVRRWVTLHGISLNVEPDLSHFAAITPCGIDDPRYGVTSLVDLGLPVTMAEADIALRATFESLFGPTVSDTSTLSRTLDALISNRR